MSDLSHPARKELSEHAPIDQRTSYDARRQSCPVDRDNNGYWQILRHADVSQVLHQHEVFSNRVSRHLSVPNGMDPPEHTAYRQLIEPYFGPARMDAFAPVCETIANDLTQKAFSNNHVELVGALAEPFALRIQCSFMGWPESVEQQLSSWAQRSEQATRTLDRPQLSQLAAEFEEIIRALLETRRQAKVGPEHDLTAALLHEQVNGRPLNDREIASILRNWTVGEIGTIAAAVGILAHYLAQNPALQEQLRADSSLLPTAIDEILRIHGPLVENRRVTQCPVNLGGKDLAAGERVVINWIAANRDPEVFINPDEFSLDRDPSLNLLYGAGIHVCPGAPLARMELLAIMQAMLRHSDSLQLCSKQPAVLARYPASGYAQLHLQVN